MVKSEYRFYIGKNGWWFVDLPDYPGPQADLQMVAGADTFLAKISRPAREVTLKVSEASFERAEVLKLDKGYNEEHGDYILEEYQGETINHKMWLCPVITYIFGKLPEVIYFKTAT